MTTLIAMGQEGIRQNMACGEKFTNNVTGKNLNTKICDERFLPKSMFEALAEAEGSVFLL